MTILVFVIGLAVLIVGAEALIRGASRLAAFFGISPLVIGLTVIAFATSSPELAVSIQSAVSNQANIAVGNIIGSNIFNILFIIGVSAIIAPLIIAQQLLRIEIPLMIAISIVVLILSLDENFSRSDGFLMIAGLIIYVWLLLKQSHNRNRDVKKDYTEAFDAEKYSKSFLFKNSGLVLAGIILLMLGSHWLVDSAVSIAGFLGVSELIIGLTIVAASTSLPEVVTSLTAVFRGERDIAVGNVIGSNIFNLMGVLGFTSVISSSGIKISTMVIGFDLPVMIVVAMTCLPMCFTGGRISRKEGVLLLGYYAIYTLYLVLAASHHDALPKFNMFMLYFVIPLSVMILIIMILREIHNRKKNLPE